MASLIEVAKAVLSSISTTSGSKKKTRLSSKAEAHHDLLPCIQSGPDPKRSTASPTASADVFPPVEEVPSTPWSSETFVCSSSINLPHDCLAERRAEVEIRSRETSSSEVEAENQTHSNAGLEEEGNHTSDHRYLRPKVQKSLPPRFEQSEDLPVDSRLMYERRVLKYRLPDEDLLKLKEALRSKLGLARMRRTPPKCGVDIRQPPRVPPRSNLTSRGRMVTQRHKLIVRCTNILQLIEKSNELAKLPAHEARSKFRQLRNEIMNRTVDEMDLQMEQAILENLKSLAASEKCNTVKSRENKVSKLRFKHSRGLPIISSHFRENYDGYRRPPFLPVTRRMECRTRELPKIDTKREIWLVPVDDSDPSRPPPMSEKLKEDPNDRRSKREKARPPLRRKGERVVRNSLMRLTEADDNNGKKRKPRPPWRLPSSCVYPV